MFTQNRPRLLKNDTLGTHHSFKVRLQLTLLRIAEGSTRGKHGFCNSLQVPDAAREAVTDSLDGRDERTTTTGILHRRLVASLHERVHLDQTFAKTLALLTERHSSVFRRFCNDRHLQAICKDVVRAPACGWM